jgi:hypothetical protein
MAARCHVPEASAQADSSTCEFFASVPKRAYPAALRSAAARATSPPAATVAAITLSGAAERAHTWVKKSLASLTPAHTPCLPHSCCSKPRSS